MKQLYLYSTLGCHLCEEAKAILWPLLDQFDFRLQEVDIAEQDELLEKYGVTIPVLSTPDERLQLNWPFDGAMAKAFLTSL